MTNNPFEKKYHKYKHKYLSLNTQPPKLFGTKYTKRNNFEEKYYKYKYKYLKQKSVGGGAYDDEDPTTTTTTESTQLTTEYGIDNEYIPPSKQSQQHDIGLYGLTRGITQNITKTNKHNLLTISTNDEFDNFTDKYGEIYDNKLFIRWDNVAKEHSAFYVNPGLNADRYNSALYKNKEYTSWWSTEYPYPPNSAIIFKPFQYKKHINAIQKTQSNPFPAKLFLENEFTKDDYGNSGNKILLINSIKTFDEFTNKYGQLTKTNTISINWDKVIPLHKGIYLDKDAMNMFYARHNTAFYNGQKYTSWWKSSNLHKGIVYIFK